MTVLLISAGLSLLVSSCDGGTTNAGPTSPTPVTPKPPAHPDLYVHSVEFLPKFPKPGKPFILIIKAAYGSAPPGPYDVNVSIHHHARDGWTYPDGLKNQSISPGQSSFGHSVNAVVGYEGAHSLFVELKPNGWEDANLANNRQEYVFQVTEH